MTLAQAHSIRQVVAILSFLGLTLLLVGAGCTDNGGAIGPGDDEGNGNGMDTDSVSFTNDVLPVFQANCSGLNCHVGADNPAQGLSLESYADVIAGSNTRDVVIPGNAQDSEIIKRLEGRSQPSMPFGQPLLPQATVNTVRDWIDQGALDN